jgi:hypothetical protein
MLLEKRDQMLDELSEKGDTPFAAEHVDRGLPIEFFANLSGNEAERNNHERRPIGCESAHG